MSKKYAQLSWKENTVPISNQFNDAHYSSEDGLLETNYVFIDGNGLYERLKHGFQITELGFGTGLNFFSFIRSLEQSIKNWEI